MALVPDASAIVSLAFPDEDPGYAAAVIDIINGDQAFVPSLFWFEVRNALLMGERRRRITLQQTSAFVGDLALLPFEIDDQLHEASVMDLARKHQLTVYDAVYLELAQRKSLPLATVDQALARAARVIGVAIWQPGC
jgi:predicted nucleic acid-binding protein